MTFKFSQRSLSNLKGVHPDLVQVAYRALDITTVDFMVIDGVRTAAEQRELVRRGKSTTMNSRHIPRNGYSHAIDIVPIVHGVVSWNWEHFYPLETAMKQAAKDCGVPIEWGGDWKSFKDGPHWQLPWDAYS